MADEARRAFSAPNSLPRDTDESDAAMDERERQDDFRNLRPSLLLPSNLPARPKPLTLLRPDLQSRSATDPTLMLKNDLQADLSPNLPAVRPHSSHSRNRSPFARSHLRSKSSGAGWSSAPPMTRAHSLPNPHTHALGRDFSQLSFYSFNSPSSPHRSPTRVPSPLRAGADDIASTVPVPRGPAWLEVSNANVVETIEEDSELELTPRSVSGPAALTAANVPSSRSRSLRKRPASPLQNIMGLPNPVTPVHTSYLGFASDTLASSAHASGSSSPAVSSLKYNESYPSLLHYASSSSFGSMPSTPTSQRSRSPSISSLETIEDAPDLESRAIEAERIERLRAAAERQENGDSGDEISVRRRSSFDMSRGSGRTSRERKRWSVCGGERRADLDLETIWED